MPPAEAPGLARRLALALEELWIALFAWVPTPLGQALRMLAWQPLFAEAKLPRLGTALALAGCRNMRLGRGVRLGRGCVISATDGSLFIGDGSALSPYANVGADHGRITIGCRVAIGPGSVLRAANHRFDQADRPIMTQGHRPGYIEIEDDVWIGANCVITPDVRIGHGSVVGAGSVVTRDVPPLAVVGGVPARIIGRRGQ